MTSILTNNAAMAALQTLRTIDTNMQDTQARVSSGLRVGEASDNAAYWSIATTMRSDNMALSAVEDALGLGGAKVDTAYAAMDTTVDVVTEIKAKLVAAREAGVDRAKIQEEITQLQQQLVSIANSASFSGENWLSQTITDDLGNLSPVIKQVVGSFVRDGSGNVGVKTIDVPLDNTSVLFDRQGGDPTTKAGILDSIAYYSDTGSYETFAITTTGTPDTTNIVAAKSYSSAQLQAGVTTPATDYVLDATTGLVTITNAIAPVVNGVYFQAGKDQFVKLDTTPPTTKSAIGTDGAGAPVYLDETNAPDPLTYSVSTLNLTTDLTGIPGLTQEQTLDAMITFIDKQLEAVVSATADLGSVTMRIGMQEEFISKLTDSIDSGVGRLVDADMNEESTRLKALQTQQQLGIQSLSIANTASEGILTLFRQ